MAERLEFYEDDVALVRRRYDWRTGRSLGPSEVLTPSGWRRRLDDVFTGYVPFALVRRICDRYGVEPDDPVRDGPREDAPARVDPYRSALRDALEHPIADEGPLRVWLDDDVEDRAAPEGWMHVITAREACLLLMTRRVEALSLDHDLGARQQGGDDPRFGNGHQVIDFLDEQAGLHGRDLWPWGLIQLHTANAAQRDSMARALLTVGRRHGVGIHEIEPAGTKRRFRRAVTEPGRRQIRDGSGD